MGRIGLSKEAITTALQELSDALAGQDAKGEICLFGGTVMVLAYAARVSTKDVDAIFQPATLIRTLAGQIAESNNLPENWLNDGVKGFVSTKHDVIEGSSAPIPNLRLTMPTAEYLLAMKCMASRIGATEQDPGDVQDIIFLIRHLKLENARQAMQIVAQYYPENRIPVKAQYLIDGLFSEGKI